MFSQIKIGVNVWQRMGVCKIYEREPIRIQIELNRWKPTKLQWKKIQNHFFALNFWETTWKLFTHVLRKLKKTSIDYNLGNEKLKPLLCCLTDRKQISFIIILSNSCWCVWCFLIFSWFDFLIPIERSSKAKMVNHQK